MKTIIIQLLFISALLSSCSRNIYQDSENVSSVSNSTDRTLEEYPILFTDNPLTKVNVYDNLESSKGLILANFQPGRSEPIFNYDHLALTYLVELVNKGKLDTYKIIGHTNSQGSEKANFELSLNRAKMVKQLLIKHYELEGDVINSEGDGESNPIASNQSKEGRASNSRVEIKMNDR